MYKLDALHTTRYLSVLYLCYFTLFLAVTLMGYKVISLGSLFTAPGTGLVFTFTFFLGSVVTEIYGYRIMRHLIWYTFFYGALFVALISLFSILPSPKYWYPDVVYSRLFFHLFHFSVACGLSFLVGAFLNAYIIAKTKVKFKGQYFWLRSFVAATISEIVTSVVSMFITLFGAWDVRYTLDVLSDAFLYKLGYSVVGMLIAVALVWWLKKSENLDTYDRETRFTPFKLSV